MSNIVPCWDYLVSRKCAYGGHCRFSHKSYQSLISEFKIRGNENRRDLKGFSICLDKKNRPGSDVWDGRLSLPDTSTIRTVFGTSGEIKSYLKSLSGIIPEEYHYSTSDMSSNKRWGHVLVSATDRRAILQLFDIIAWLSDNMDLETHSSHRGWLDQAIHAVGLTDISSKSEGYPRHPRTSRRYRSRSPTSRSSNADVETAEDREYRRGPHVERDDLSSRSERSSKTGYRRRSRSRSREKSDLKNETPDRIWEQATSGYSHSPPAGSYSEPLPSSPTTSSYPSSSSPTPPYPTPYLPPSSASHLQQPPSPASAPYPHPPHQSYPPPAYQPPSLANQSYPPPTYPPPSPSNITYPPPTYPPPSPANPTYPPSLQGNQPYPLPGAQSYSSSSAQAPYAPIPAYITPVYQGPPPPQQYTSQYPSEINPAPFRVLGDHPALRSREGTPGHPVPPSYPWAYITQIPAPPSKKIEDPGLPALDIPGAESFAEFGTRRRSAWQSDWEKKYGHKRDEWIESSLRKEYLHTYRKLRQGKSSN